MKHSDSLGALAASLVAAQTELKAIAKDSTNPHFKSKFASLDTIVDTVRPILAKQGLAIIQGAANPITDDAGGLCGFAVETMLIHKSGEWMRNDAIMPLAKIDPQGAGSAMTYGRRYGLSALLCLSTEEDDDGNTATARPHQASSPASTNGAPSATAKAASGNANPRAHSGNGGAADKLMPFGKTKGKKLGALPDEELSKTLKWCLDTDAEKFKDLIGSIRSVLNDRALGVPTPTSDEFPAALRDETSMPWDD